MLVANAGQVVIHEDVLNAWQSEQSDASGGVATIALEDYLLEVEDNGAGLSPKG